MCVGGGGCAYAFAPSVWSGLHVSVLSFPAASMDKVSRNGDRHALGAGGFSRLLLLVTDLSRNGQLRFDLL